MIEESSATLAETRRHIASLIGEAKSVSENGREVWTNHFNSKLVYVAPEDKVKDRFSAHLLILGERRPYDIEVRVYREIRQKNGTFAQGTLDLKQSKRLAQQLKVKLNESREKRNVIDDFQAF